MNHVGITRMAFDVDNIDEIYEKLRQRGDVEISCEPVNLTAISGGYHKVMTFSDPYGIVVEPIEYHRPAGKKE
jgi:hypothetical protein